MELYTDAWQNRPASLRNPQFGESLTEVFSFVTYGVHNGDLTHATGAWVALLTYIHRELFTCKFLDA